jgi:hypothetical protein
MSVGSQFDVCTEKGPTAAATPQVNARTRHNGDKVIGWWCISPDACGIDAELE